MLFHNENVAYIHWGSGEHKETVVVVVVCADMAVQNVIGDSFRGATWVALHNGGGVGW